MQNLPNKFTANLPANIEAEQAALGALLIDPTAFYEVGVFDPNAFYLERHAHIYRAIATLVNDNRPLDYVSVCAELRQRGQLEAVGGEAYLVQLAHATPTAVHAKMYFELVQREYARRQLIRAASEIAGIGYDSNGITPQEMIARATKALTNADVVTGDAQGVSLDDAMAVFDVALMDYCDTARHAGVSGIATGLDLDKYLGGLHRQELLVISGDPGIGKTALTLDLALGAANHNHFVVFFSLEMSLNELNLRMISNRARINATLIRRGMLDEAMRERINAERKRLAKLPMRLFCESESAASIRAKIARLKRTDAVDVVVVDYSKLLTDRADSEPLRLGNITRELKHTARDFDVAMVLVHPVSREAASQNRRPELHDLAWSWDVVYHADSIVYVWKNKRDHANDQVHNLYLVKNRNGAVVEFEMVFERETVRWHNLQKGN